MQARGDRVLPLKPQVEIIPLELLHGSESIAYIVVKGQDDCVNINHYIPPHHDCLDPHAPLRQGAVNFG